MAAQKLKIVFAISAPAVASNSRSNLATSWEFISENAENDDGALLNFELNPMADAKAADAEKQIEALRAEMDAMHDIMAGGCCPINSRGDKDIYGRKFSLPVNIRLRTLAAAAAAAEAARSLTRIAPVLCTG